MEQYRSSDSIDKHPQNVLSEARKALKIAAKNGDRDAIVKVLGSPTPILKKSALSALASKDWATVTVFVAAICDPSPEVRRHAIELAGKYTSRLDNASLQDSVIASLGDQDALVTEASAWALGEMQAGKAVQELNEIAISHSDTRCREAAIAALGAIGDPEGLKGVMAGLDDKPTVRRRSAVALAAFSGPQVDEALIKCLKDRDWQVREIAEILTDTPPYSVDH